MPFFTLLSVPATGQDVHVSLEFTRNVGGAAAGQPAAAGDAPERTLSFGTVTHTTEGAKSGANVAELLLLRGLATVSKHRS
jgi:hypothetical protein